jgi:glycosyltransferase involved in cell wall biosynthesis
MLNYEYPPVGGGTANANRYLIRELDNKGVEVDLVTSSPEKYSEEEMSDGTNIYKLDVGKEDLNYWRKSELLLYMFKGAAKARKLERENDYDLVHVWTGFPCGLMARFLKEDYIVALRGSDVPGYSSRFSNIYPFLKPLIRDIWRKAEKVIPNSQDLKRLAEETADVDMNVIENGVDVRKFSPKSKPTKKPKVITVARLVERKRVQDVIRAVKDLEIELEIVGDGPEMQDLGELVDDLGISHKVDFKGEVDHEDLPDYYRSSDIFVLPSLKEGMSNTVLEAMASGLPVIITDTGGSDVLVDGNGSVVSPRSPEEIRDELQRYIADPGKLESEGRRSREIAEARGWSGIAEEYKQIYREVVEDG